MTRSIRQPDRRHRIATAAAQSMHGQRRPIIDGWRDESFWTTRTVRPEQQFQRWCTFVNNAYLRWAIKRARFDAFPAFIRQGRFDQCRVTNMTSAQPLVTGSRSRAEISADSEPLYTVLYIAEGSEQVVMEGRDILLMKGDFVLWDATRPMTFTMGPGLRQLTFTMPHERLHAAFAGAPHCVGKALSARSGVARVFADHLASLDTNFGDMAPGEAGPTLETTILLLAATLEATLRPYEGEAPATLLAQIQSHALRHLGDPELTPTALAAHHGISARHLHRLFARAGTTPAKWIQHHRLERCRRDLCAVRDADATITEISLRWGFTDSSAFSRSFKSHYGKTPRQVRAGARRR